jgi:hypothetical protein
MLSAGPETVLSGVWARDFSKASELAEHSVPAFERPEEFLDACEAVAFAIAPEAQPHYATQAALAGKPMLLDKPISASLPEAVETVRGPHPHPLKAATTSCCSESSRKLRPSRGKPVGDAWIQNPENDEELNDPDVVWSGNGTYLRFRSRYRVHRLPCAAEVPEVWNLKSRASRFLRINVPVRVPDAMPAPAARVG